MPQEPHFHYLSSFWDNSIVVVDGGIYTLDTNADDGLLEISDTFTGGMAQGRYSLRYQGSIRDLVEAEEVARSRQVRAYQLALIEESIDGFLTFQATGLDFIYYWAATEILPNLEYFDPRIADLTKEDLVRIRQAEIREMLGVSKTGNTGSAEEVMEGIQRYIIGSSGKETEFDFEPSFLFSRNQGYATNLIPRQARGPISFRSSSMEGPMIFRPGDEFRIQDMISDLDDHLIMKARSEAIGLLSPEMLRQNAIFAITYGQEKLMINKEFEYNGAGIRFGDDSKDIWIYTKLPRFAIREPREPENHKWYYFDNPPEIGVIVSKSGTEIEVSEVLARGPAEYLTFTLTDSKPAMFCRRGSYIAHQDERWTESAVGKIIFGINLLFFGYNSDSIRTHPNRRYYRDVNNVPWKTEDSAREEGYYMVPPNPAVTEGGEVIYGRR